MDQVDRDYLRNRAEVEGYLTQDFEPLSRVKPGGILFAVVGELSRLATAKRTLFFGQMDLSSDAGVKQAARLQGEIAGIEMAIEALFLKIEEVETRSDDTNE